MNNNTAQVLSPIPRDEQVLKVLDKVGTASTETIAALLKIDKRAVRKVIKNLEGHKRIRIKNKHKTTYWGRIENKKG